MNRKGLLVVVCVALSAVGVYAGESEKEHATRQLRWVQHADPITDATAAIGKGDFRLLGVHGYAWEIPGVEESKRLEYAEQYGVRLLDGTGDQVFGAEHARLIGLARGYAKTYNLYMLGQISQHQ